MHRNIVYMSERCLPKRIKSILSFLICIIALQFPSYGQCNAGIFINEFHYDNVGVDVNEFIEVAVPNLVPVILSEYVVSLYNGSDGMVYDFETLDNFQVGNMDINYTYYVWFPASINDGLDGIALSRVSGFQFQNCEFLSYEGIFGAVNGPAMGTFSTDVGVAESSTTPIGSSLQLINGVWTGPIPATTGNTNVGSSAPGVLLISEIEICDQLVEIQNVGLTNVDASNYVLCNFPAYAPLSLTNLIGGSLLLAPGDFVTVQWNGIDQVAGEIGLYIPGTSGLAFQNPDNMVDYVQYNSINNTRAPVAVAADVWDAVANDITIGSSCVTTSIANAINPMASNSTTWCDALTATIAPPGTNSACAPPAICGVSFPNLPFLDCQMSSAGIDNVDVYLKYMGVDAGAVLEITLNGTTVVSNVGDDPALVTDGTILFTAQEGDSYVITFTDVTCMSVSSSGMIPLNECPGPAMCGVSFPNPVVLTCQSSTAGIDNVAVNLTYAGVDAGAVLDITLNGTTTVSNGGDNPASVTNGTIKFIAQEGDSYVITFTDATCMSVSSSGMIPLNECPGPAMCGVSFPNPVVLTCQSSTAGIDNVAVNLTYAGVDAGAVLDITLNGTTTVSNGGDNPASVTNGTIKFNAQEGDSYVITFTDALCSSVSSSGTISLTQCPGPAMCGVSFPGPVDLVCQTSTAGIDNVAVSLDYLGVDPGAILVITLNGSTIVPNVGDNPAVDMNGTILFPAQEGDSYVITFTDPLCSTVSSSGTIPLTQCPGPSLCGVSFPNPAVYTCQTSTAGIDNVAVGLTYAGIDPGAVLVITVNGSPVLNGGNNPATVANGTILFAAQEGDSYLITFADPLCSTVSSSGTIPLTQCPGPSLCPGALYIKGVIDGPLGGGRPKAMQLCATMDIGNLSFYGIESVDAGAGATGVEYNFPPDPLAAGDCIWLSIEEPGFISWFGFAPCYTDAVMDVDGDDALILYCGTQVLDVLGDPNCDPNAFPPMTAGDCGNWEYMDGWVFAVDAVPNPIFNELEWIYSMEDALDNEINNATAVRPYPDPGTGCPICPDDFANGGLAHSYSPLTFVLDTNADLEADGDIISNQVIGSLDPDIAVDYDSGTSILLNSNFEVFPGVTFHAFIDGCGGI